MNHNITFKNINLMKGNYDTVVGKYEDSRLKYTAAYYEYLSFTFVTLLFLGLILF